VWASASSSPGRYRIGGPQTADHRWHVTQAGALGLIGASERFAPWALATIALGAGTAMVYPTLLSAIGDVAHPRWRVSAVGVYRLWPDSGFAVGALLAGLLADAFSITAAVWAVAALAAASGVVVKVRMYETDPPSAPTHRRAPVTTTR
jgi:MFS family permease